MSVAHKTSARCQRAAHVCATRGTGCRVRAMSVALRTSTALPACIVCVCHTTHLVQEVQAMSIALGTSTALPACCAFVCHKTYLV
jgi:hypothetical protein